MKFLRLKKLSLIFGLILALEPMALAGDYEIREVNGQFRIYRDDNQYIVVNESNLRALERGTKEQRSLALEARRALRSSSLSDENAFESSSSTSEEIKDSRTAQRTYNKRNVLTVPFHEAVKAGKFAKDVAMVPAHLSGGIMSELINLFSKGKLKEGMTSTQAAERALNAIHFSPYVKPRPRSRSWNRQVFQAEDMINMYETEAPLHEVQAKIENMQNEIDTYWNGFFRGSFRNNGTFGYNITAEQKEKLKKKMLPYIRAKASGESELEFRKRRVKAIVSALQFMNSREFEGKFGQKRPREKEQMMELAKLEIQALEQAILEVSQRIVNVNALVHQEGGPFDARYFGNRNLNTLDRNYKDYVFFGKGDFAIEVEGLRDGEPASVGFGEGNDDIVERRVWNSRSSSAREPSRIPTQTPVRRIRVSASDDVRLNPADLERQQSRSQSANLDWRTDLTPKRETSVSTRESSSAPKSSGLTWRTDSREPADRIRESGDTDLVTIFRKNPHAVREAERLARENGTSVEIELRKMAQDLIEESKRLFPEDSAPSKNESINPEKLERAIDLYLALRKEMSKGDQADQELVDRLARAIASLNLNDRERQLAQQKALLRLIDESTQQMNALLERTALEAKKATGETPFRIVINGNTVTSDKYDVRVDTDKAEIQFDKKNSSKAGSARE